MWLCSVLLNSFLFINEYYILNPRENHGSICIYVRFLMKISASTGISAISSVCATIQMLRDI